jgi:Zn-dependent M28 family amino/carboxypeptidase
VKLFLLFFGLTTYMSMAQQLCDSTILLKHLNEIVNTSKPRNFKNLDILNEVARYIHKEFSEYSGKVEYQNYLSGKTEFKNVICSFGPEDAERIIVGAHYDVCEGQPGADDNASGVSGLLELARLLKGKELTKRIDLVAYSLEEPPFFGTESMGSYQHAKFLYDNKINVYGMISLEMIGYFSDVKGSQNYPIRGLSLIYGKTGNFITTVRKFGSGKFAKKFNKQMRKNDFVKHKSFIGPKSIRGIDFSDHRNYWKFGFSACMLTDTAFMRNPNYHQKTDTIESLDLTRMAAVIDAVFGSLIKLNK